jgi:hypothetical protein
MEVRLIMFFLSFIASLWWVIAGFSVLVMLATDGVGGIENDNCPSGSMATDFDYFLDFITPIGAVLCLAAGGLSVISGIITIIAHAVTPLMGIVAVASGFVPFAMWQRNRIFKKHNSRGIE